MVAADKIEAIVAALEREKEENKDGAGAER
jgi:hypothetical protein